MHTDELLFDLDTEAMLAELRLVANVFRAIFALDSTVDVEQPALILETGFASKEEQLVGIWKKGSASK